jgi:hypothetical protein
VITLPPFAITTIQTPVTTRAQNNAQPVLIGV